MKLLLLSVVLVGAAFAGIAIKILLKKNGEFDGTCAGKNIRMKQNGIVCGCGKQDGCETNMDNINSTGVAAKTS